MPLGDGSPRNMTGLLFCEHIPSLQNTSHSAPTLLGCRRRDGTEAAVDSMLLGGPFSPETTG